MELSIPPVSKKQGIGGKTIKDSSILQRQSLLKQSERSTELLKLVPAFEKAFQLLRIDKTDYLKKTD